MREQIKKEIEELKKVVLDLHRSAGSLDEYIQMLENEFEQTGFDDEYSKIFARQIQQYRMDVKTRRGFNKLEEKENDIWQQLINAVDEERAQ